MENLCLKIMNKNMEALAVARGENEVNLVYAGEYQEGDIIILEVSEGSHYAWLQWDDAIGKSLVYLTGNVTYKIPFGPTDQSVAQGIFREEASVIRKAGKGI